MEEIDIFNITNNLLTGARGNDRFAMIQTINFPKIICS